MILTTLFKIEKMGESHMCSRLYDNAKDAATMTSIFDKMDLSEKETRILTSVFAGLTKK